MAKIDPKTLAQQAASRLTRQSADRRFFGKQDRTYEQFDYADFTIDDAMIRIHMNNYLSFEFIVSAEDETNLDRQAIIDKYATAKFLQFRDAFNVLAKGYVVSVPMNEKRGVNQVFGRAVEDNLHIHATRTDHPDGRTTYKVETLFGAFSI